MFWMYHDYKWNLQEWKSFILKKDLKEKKKMQEYNVKRVHQLKPDLAAAEFFMLIGGKVKFVNDDNWYKKYEKGTLPVPRKQKDGYFTEGIDASETLLLDVGLEYLNGLKHLQYLSLARCKYVDDWYIERILELSPTIQALDISGCERITDSGLEMMHKIPNIKVLNVSNCPGIKCGQAIATFLEEFCPDLTIIGLDTLHRLEDSAALHKFELENSRYMNWGHIMNSRLGLNNEVDLEQVIKSRPERIDTFKQETTEDSQDNPSSSVKTDTSEIISDRDSKQTEAVNR